MQMATLQSFTFDEATHVYTVDGVAIQSVTQILSDLGYSNYEAAERFNAEAVEYKRKLGKLVHQACHFYDEHDLPPEEKLPEAVRNRLAGYKRFRADTGYVPVMNEGRQIGELYGMRYGMQFDSIGICGQSKSPWLVDIKNASGAPQRSWAIQTAAYTMGACNAAFLSVLHRSQTRPAWHHSEFIRVIVQLFDDGGYKVFSSQDQSSKIFRPEDFQVWQACLCVAIDKRNHKLDKRRL